MNSGVVFDMPAVDYHATHALSASGAWKLASACPAIYWHGSPFNPAAEKPDPNKIMSVGTGVHLAVLEPKQLAARIAIVPYADYRKADAKVMRDNAIAAGRTPVLEEEYEDIRAMREAILGNALAAELLDGARTEVSYFWELEGIRCKARADIVCRAGRIGDLKASADASPDFFQRRAWDDGHFLRDPWYRDGWFEASGRRCPEYWFIVVARKAPHLVTTLQLDDRAVAWGQMMRRRALTLFHRCMRSGVWPGYSNDPVTIGLPRWAEYQLADREQEGRFDPGEIDRALGFLAP